MTILYGKGRVCRMNINTIINSIYRKTDAEKASANAANQYKTAYRASQRTDSLEISAEAYQAQSEDEKMTASSGNDALGITRGSREDAYVIHFSDSAMVSRAVSRGYITVNGIRIDLSEEVKNQLTEMDKQAQADRERAYNEYILQHELAVAQQQGETLKKLSEDVSKALEIAAQISRGGKVSHTDEQMLMEFNPQLYAMAKVNAMMERRHEKQQDETVYKAENNLNNGNMQENTAKGVEWSSFSWKTYETQMKVSLTAGACEIQEISEGEISLSDGDS